MPDDTSLRVRFQIVPANHNLTLLKVFSNGEGKEILIDLPVQVELFDEERGTLATGYRGKTDDAITCHAGQALLVCRCNEGHVGYALIRLGGEAHLVRGSVPPDMPAPIADLAQLARVVSSERRRLLVIEVVLSCTCLTLWCLYPEPGTASVENQLVWLSSAAKVDC